MNFTVSHWLKMTMMVTTTVSLRNTTAERRGRQNACVRQTWQGYYLRVLWWPSLKLMFAGLLHKDLSKGGSSSAKTFFKQNYCHACHTRFAVFFPLPSRCVSSLIGSLSNYDDDHNDDLKKTTGLMIKTTALFRTFLWRPLYATTWNPLIWRFMEDVDIRRRIFLHLFEPE